MDVVDFCNLYNKPNLTCVIKYFPESKCVMTWVNCDYRLTLIYKHNT